MIYSAFAAGNGARALYLDIKISRGNLDSVLAHGCGLVRAVCSRRGRDAVPVKVDDDLVSCRASFKR
jgi:hypothetical protein